MDHFDCLTHSCHLYLRHRSTFAAALHGDTGQVDVMNRIMSENLTGAKTIKAYVLEDHQLTQFNTENRNLQTISQRAVLATVTLAPPIMLVLESGRYVAALAYGGNLAISRTITTGEIMAFVTLHDSKLRRR